MSYKKGVVEVASVKVRTSGQGKEYGSASLKIDNEWFSGFAKNTDNGYKILDKNKNEVANGQEVEFMYETNDKGYHNFDGKTLMILASGSASQPVQATNAPQTTTNTNELQKSSETDENGLTDKFCDGLAALIAAYKFKGKEKPKQEQIDRVANYIKKMF